MSKGRAVVAIVNYNGNVLVGKKRQDSAKFMAGKWNFPGENVEAGETDEQALIRGIREEARIEITAGRYIASSLSPSGKDVRWYECHASTDKVRAGSDLEQILWVPRASVMQVCREISHLWPEEIKKYIQDTEHQAKNT